MRRHKFPRFAPESLERKLNPSGLVVAPVAAEIYVPVTQTSDTGQATPIMVNASLTAPLSSVTVVTTADPAVSATTTDPNAVGTIPGTPTPTPTPIEPGDPEPVDPEVPSGGTGPAPPDGDGTVPYDPPSVPGGPPLPALA